MQAHGWVVLAPRFFQGEPSPDRTSVTEFAGRCKQLCQKATRQGMGGRADKEHRPAANTSSGGNLGIHFTFTCVVSPSTTSIHCTQKQTPVACEFLHVLDCNIPSTSNLSSAGLISSSAEGHPSTQGQPILRVVGKGNEIEASSKQSALETHMKAVAAISLGIRMSVNKPLTAISGLVAGYSHMPTKCIRQTAHSKGSSRRIKRTQLK